MIHEHPIPTPIYEDRIPIPIPIPSPSPQSRTVHDDATLTLTRALARKITLTLTRALSRKITRTQASYRLSPARALAGKINEDYRVNWIVDNLPAATRVVYIYIYTIYI